MIDREGRLIKTLARTVDGRREPAAQTTSPWRIVFSVTARGSTKWSR